MAVCYVQIAPYVDGGHMHQLSRNAQVLRYLLDAAPGVGHTKLAKFAYLADLEARRYLGQPISTFEYKRWHFGPFDPSFYAAKDELVGAGFATSRKEWIGNYQGHCLEPTPAAVEYDFSLAEAEVLRYVAQTYMSMTARGLCDDVVYETEPMKNEGVGMWDHLPVEALNNSAKDKLGFKLQRMLDGEASAKAGRTRSASTVMNELRARVI